jgi:hypothetical protein
MTSGGLPDVLRISVQTKGKPMAGAWADITFGMARKNRHGTLAGPTDENGEVIVQREDIEESARHASELSPMDYVGLDAWDGTIRVEAINRERVRGIVSAVDLWEDLGSLRTEENLRALRRYGEFLETIAGEELSVSASCEPGDAAEIETVGARA